MTQLPTAVQRVLDGLTTGNWEGLEQHLTPDVLHDASMPGWRMQYQGANRVAAEMRSWPTMHIQEQAVTQADATVVVELQAIHDSPNGELLERLVNIFELRDGRIAEHRYYCCGEWDDETVHKIETDAPKVRV